VCNPRLQVSAITRDRPQAFISTNEERSSRSCNLRRCRPSLACRATYTLDWMPAHEEEVLALTSNSPELGEATWVRSGEVRWLPRIGTEPVAGDEFARREARLAERLRHAFGTSPYRPVTRDVEAARQALGTAMEAQVQESLGEPPSCTCRTGVPLVGDDAEHYADFHLAFTRHDDYSASSGYDSSIRTYTCPLTRRSWRLGYRGVKSPRAELSPLGT
jgi:hypothetical protein